MDTIRITSERNLSLGDLAKTLSARLKVEETADHGLVIQEYGTRVYIHFADEHDVRNPKELNLDYSSVALAKKIIVIIANDARMTVDDDFGTILPGNKFVERIKSEPAWN